MLDAVADAGLCAEVHDRVERMHIGDLLQCVGIGKIHPLKAEAVAILPLQTVEPRLLQRRIVIIVEIVDPDDLVTAVEEGARRGPSDEPCSPRDQNSHKALIGGAVEGAKALERPRESFMDLRH